MRLEKKRGKKARACGRKEGENDWSKKSKNAAVANLGFTEESVTEKEGRGES